MMARARGSLFLALAGAGLVGLAAAPVAAQEQRGFASNNLDVSERGSRWFVLDSVDIQGDGRLALGLVNDYSYRSLVAYDADGNVHSSIVRNQLMTHLGASMTLGDRVRLGLSVPLQVYVDGHRGIINGVVHEASEDVSVGDVRLSLDGRVLGTPGDVATLAIGGELFAPSGSPNAYTGDGKPRVGPRIAFAGRAGAFAYAARVGALFHARQEAWGDGYIGHQLTYGASAGLLLADGHALVGPELFGSTVLQDGRAFENRTSPLELLLGSHVDLGHNLRIGAAIGTGVTRGYGAPVFRTLLSFEWVPPDAVPDVPVATVPERVTDRDGDGVLDCEDACGFVPGVKNLDPTRNGCPADTDNDGVADAVDACMSIPGIASADAKTNGCPPDLDADGVYDNEDACPREPGKRSADPKISGCPDRPAPAPAPAEPERPKAFLEGGAIRITDQVKFKTNSAELQPGKDSEDVLAAVLAVLQAHPEVKALRIEGHTDGRGDPAHNKTLSQQRAETVAKWLEAKGIAKGVLTSEGYGAEKPIDTNDTEAGRTNNRRVELKVQQQQGSGR